MKAKLTPINIEILYSLVLIVLLFLTKKSGLNNLFFIVPASALFFYYLGLKNYEIYKNGFNWLVLLSNLLITIGLVWLIYNVYSGKTQTSVNLVLMVLNIVFIIIFLDKKDGRRAFHLIQIAMLTQLSNV